MFEDNLPPLFPSPNKKAKFEPRQDKGSLYIANEFTPHEPTILNNKCIILTKPNSLKLKSHQWKYYHFVSYNTEFGPKPENHNPGDEYVCCNICGRMGVYRSMMKDGKTKSSHSFMLAHLKSHNVYPPTIKILDDDTATSNTPSIKDTFNKMASRRNVNDKKKEGKHKLDSSLLESYHYINSVPGKDVRGKLIDCFQLWLKVDSQDVLKSIKEIIGDLHNASLLIDDIEDNSKLRRGQPVAHSIFGVAQVINTANYVYFLALSKCQDLNNAEAMKVFVDELLNLHRGQGHDIMWRDNVKCPTEEEYYGMILDKTGGLFRLAVGLMQAFATINKGKDFTPLVNNLGLYFQIRDDLINLSDEEYFKSKSFCEDLTEGKFSFPIIHCVRNSKEDDSRLISILKQRTEDIDLKKYAQSLMRNAGSLKYTRDKCIELKETILSQIEDLGGNAPLTNLINILDVQVEGLASAVMRDTESKKLNIDSTS